MAKLNEFLKEILAPVFKKQDELEMFVSASALREIEIPDEVKADFNNKYLTRERALTDDEIVKKFNIQARGYVFDSVDLKIKKLKSKLTEDDQRAIDAEPNTLIKLELLDKALDNLGKNDDLKKIQETARKRESELHEKISAMENIIKEKDTTFGKQIQGVKLDYALRTKMAAIQLAPEFSSDKHRNFLADSTINSLKKNFVLEFDEKDDSIINIRKNVDGVITDVYEGNKKVTLNDVLEKEYEPYTKKNNGVPNPPHTTPPGGGLNNQPPVDRPITLADRIRASAEQGA